MATSRCHGLQSLNDASTSIFVTKRRAMWDTDTYWFDVAIIASLLTLDTILFGD